MIRRWLKGLLAGLFVALVGVGLAMSPLGTGLEQRVGLSWLFDRRGPVEPPAEVAVVAMDSRTGDQLGLPALPRDWPRSIHAQLVDALVARGAAVIVFDVHFGRREGRRRRSGPGRRGRAGRAGRAGRTADRQTPADQRPAGPARRHGLVRGTGAAVRRPRGGRGRPGDLPAAQGGRLGLSVLGVQAEHRQCADPAGGRAAAACARADAAGVLDLRACGPPRRSPRCRCWIRHSPMARSCATSCARCARASSVRATGSGPSTRPVRPTPPILPEQALEHLYAGESHRFLNFYGPPGTITTVPYHAVINGGDPNVPAEALDFQRQGGVRRLLRHVRPRSAGPLLHGLHARRRRRPERRRDRRNRLRQPAHQPLARAGRRLVCAGHPGGLRSR